MNFMLSWHKQMVTAQQQINQFAKNSYFCKIYITFFQELIDENNHNAAQIVGC